MAVYDLEEQERIAELKDWWEKWSLWVYMGIGAFIIGVAGTQGWSYYQRSQAEAGEALFKNMRTLAQEVVASKDWKKLSAAATALADKHPQTFYATDAQLIAAKAAFDGGDLTAARKHLEWVVANGRPIHQNAARLRLAAVYLDEKKYDEALKILDAVRDDGFASASADLKGDIFAAQNRRDEARAAYQMAVDKAETRSPYKEISQAKLDAFGGAVEKPAGKNIEKPAATNDLVKK